LGVVLGCAAGLPAVRDADSYLRSVAFEEPISNERILLRWPAERMPLRVYLPTPPESLFEDPEAVHDSVRDGVLGWAGSAGPDLPSFTFVEDIGDADIPIVWAGESSGDWYVAYCTWDVDVLKRRFGVAQILVTGRWEGGRPADLREVYETVLHEMGHALGFAGHSPDPGDIMFPSLTKRAVEGLSARDRATIAELYARPIGARVVGARISR
jgi:hypothetical protein